MIPRAVSLLLARMISWRFRWSELLVSLFGFLGSADNGENVVSSPGGGETLGDDLIHCGGRSADLFPFSLGGNEEGKFMPMATSLVSLIQRRRALVLSSSAQIPPLGMPSWR